MLCCKSRLGVCVGSTPLTYSICHHVTHLQFIFSTCHLGNFHPFVFYTCFLLQSELRGLAGVHPSCHGAKASCQFATGPQWKTNHHWHSQTQLEKILPTTETFVFRGNYQEENKPFLNPWLSLKKVPPLDNSGILERQITAFGSTALIPHTSLASFE